jgi:hypothetical protein
MLFRKKDGTLIEIIKSNFTTDKAYYEYILTIV